MQKAMLRELELRVSYLQDTVIESIYFGGGTPSLLDVADLTSFFEYIHRLFRVAPDAEITLEANPDDLTPEKLHRLRTFTPVNRLSIGIQSFRKEDLQWMNRAHNAREARACLDAAHQMGFEDLTIDLIYGTPYTSDAVWAENLDIAFGYGIPHLSCYCLTVEEGTALHHFVRQGKTPPIDEEKAVRQLEYLMEAAPANGYEQYEISNFARDRRYARHNSNYWRGKPYLGIGPSAHSYDGTTRQWNVAHNIRYIEAMRSDQPEFEKEVLSPQNRYNEYIMTALRTIWGVDPQRLRLFGEGCHSHFIKAVQLFLVQGVVEVSNGCYCLTQAGRLRADGIAAELFWV